MPDLFQGKPLQNDTGLLRERWDQDGTTLTSATATTTSTGGTIYTVTSGKIFYCKTLIVAMAAYSTASLATIKDNSTAKASVSFTTDGTFTINFDAPVAFLTSVVVAHANMGAFGTTTTTVVGWEEKA